MNIYPSIKYIGVDDNDIDLFESQYKVPNGISYNSYLLIDEKIAIIDTADARKAQEWWNNLSAALDGRTPHYLVSLHMEPDHSSLIAQVMERYPELKLVASPKAIQMLPQFFGDMDTENRCIAMKEGDILPLGKHTLTFMNAPMVHWPEVLVCYDTYSKTLFSADAFGKFGSLSHDEPWDDEARRYYLNICGKYGMQVQALLKKAAALDIARICPLHGPMLSENLAHYVGLYDKWSSYTPETDGVLVAYASIYGGTTEAAIYLANLLQAAGKQVVTIDLCRCDMSHALSEAFRMSHLAVCAASYDAGLFPPMHDFLYHLKIKNYQSRKVGIIENGSWAPTAGRVMRTMLEEMKNMEIVEPMVTIRSRMKKEDTVAIEQLANALLS